MPFLQQMLPILRHAEKLKENEPLHTVNQFRNFPNLLSESHTKPAQNSITSWPLLSVIIAYLTEQTNAPNLVATGNKLLILTAGAKCFNDYHLFWCSGLLGRGECCQFRYYLPRTWYGVL